MQKLLTEKEAEEFLEKQGFSVVKRAIAKKIEDISDIQKKIAFPWAMKISSSKISHKAKLGGVILNIENSLKAQEVFDSLSKIEGFEEAIIQEMFSGEEIILGLKKTPEFGHAIMFGKGGSNVEKEKDISFRIIPATQKELIKMIKETKIYKQLEEKEIDLKSIIKLLIKIEELAKKYPHISELDINPLTINKNKMKIIDARMVLEN
ncbi:MAG: acetate--CoA ligase family protein [archaeon]|nr:acetate--CoA ligase family protein [archaeon]